MINNKFLYFASKAGYEAQLANISSRSIVFVDQPEVKSGDTVAIPAERFIVTHGKTFSTNFDPSAIEAAIEELDGRLDILQGSNTTAGSVAKSILDAINALDVAAVNGSTTGEAIISISETNGKISATKGNVAASHVTVADAGNKLAATTVEAALAEIISKLEALDFNSTTATGHTAGKAIVGVTQTDGLVSATEGTVKSAYVSYDKVNIGTASNPVYNTNNTDLQAIITEIFSKIASGGEAGIVAVYKDSVTAANKVNTIAADGHDYIFTQGSGTVATLNIAKDMVISSGSVITATGSEKNGTSSSATSAGLTAGDKYIKLTVANGDEKANIIYIPVNSLYKDHTTQQNATKIQLSIDNNNVISAAVVTGSIDKTDLTTAVQNEITSARTTINTKTTGHVRVSKTTGTGATPDSYTISENDIASAALVGTIPTGATATTVVGYAQEVANSGADTAKAYADSIKVNNKSQSNQNITVNAGDITIESGYAKASTNTAVASGDTLTVAAGKLEKKADDALAAAQAIKVNGKTQSSGAITVTGADIKLTGYTAKTGATTADVQATDTVNVLIIFLILNKFFHDCY